MHMLYYAGGKIFSYSFLKIKMLNFSYKFHNVFAITSLCGESSSLREVSLSVGLLAVRFSNNSIQHSCFSRHNPSEISQYENVFSFYHFATFKIIWPTLD